MSSFEVLALAVAMAAVIVVSFSFGVFFGLKFKIPSKKVHNDGLEALFSKFWMAKSGDKLHKVGGRCDSKYEIGKVKVCTFCMPLK